MMSEILAQVISNDGIMHTIIDQRVGMWAIECSCGWATTVGGYIGRTHAKAHVQAIASDSLVQLVRQPIEFI